MGQPCCGRDRPRCGLRQPLAHAQTNLDEGKTPAQIFATDCSACHKAHAALANGIARLFHRGSCAPTTRRAANSRGRAYVLGAGFGAAKPANEPPKSTKAEGETPARRQQQVDRGSGKQPRGGAGRRGGQPKLQRARIRPGAGRSHRRQANTTATRDPPPGGRTHARGTLQGARPRLAEPASTSSSRPSGRRTGRTREPCRATIFPTLVGRIPIGRSALVGWSGTLGGLGPSRPRQRAAIAPPRARRKLPLPTPRLLPPSALRASASCPRRADRARFVLVARDDDRDRPLDFRMQRRSARRACRSS